MRRAVDAFDPIDPRTGVERRTKRRHFRRIVRAGGNDPFIRREPRSRGYLHPAIENFITEFDDLDEEHIDLQDVDTLADMLASVRNQSRSAPDASPLGPLHL